MKTPVLLPLGAALVLGTAAAASAQDVIVYWPLVPGPSGYVGPHMPGSWPTSRYQQPIRPPMPQMRVGAQVRTPDHATLRPGEPDETGRIGPTARFKRDADGKLWPTYHPLSRALNRR
jgi:hypothetical protein